MNRIKEEKEKKKLSKNFNQRSTVPCNGSQRTSKESEPVETENLRRNF